MSKQPSWQGPAPESIIAWSIVQAGHFAGQQFYRQLRTADLTPTQFGALLHLDRNNGVSNAALARAIHVSPQSMSDLLSSLETVALIERQSSAGRGHPVTITLTPAGQDRLRSCQSIIETIERNLGLTTSEAFELNKLLRKVITHLEQ